MFGAEGRIVVQGNVSRGRIEMKGSEDEVSGADVGAGFGEQRERRDENTVMVVMSLVVQNHARLVGQALRGRCRSGRHGNEEGALLPDVKIVFTRLPIPIARCFAGPLSVSIQHPDHGLAFI